MNKEKEKIKVYVGCSLTHSSEEFKQSIADFKDQLRPHVEILDFLGLGAPSAKEAFEWDIACVKRCDLLITNITYPSIGSGVEWGVAYSLKKPIITIAQKDIKVSRFVFGYEDATHFTLRYNTNEDAIPFILEKMEYLFPSQII